jgi:subtilase family serine protease
MQTQRNSYSQVIAKIWTRAFSRAMAALIATFLLLMTAFVVQADPGAKMGGGNFVDGETGTDIVNRYTALSILGARMCRMNLYPDNYYVGSAAVPTLQDAAILQAHANNITPMFLFEYYGDYAQQGIPLGGYSKWFAIGRDFATRFRPNSPWLISQGINGWGVSVYSAMNEPDNEGLIPTNGTNSYQNALEGLADGVHSVDASLKVIPGGFMAENAYNDSTLNGYGTAIASLLNNGKLDGIDLHTYNDIENAPIVEPGGNSDTFDRSPQSDFDSIKTTLGITRDINFYSTEFNSKNDPSQGLDENAAAKLFFTCIWANLGVVKNDGHTSATQFAFPYTIFDSDDSTYSLNTQLSPWVPRARGTTMQLVLDKTAGMEFVTLDPKGRGEFILNGNNKKMWVWTNYATWSSIFGTSYTVTGIPVGATKLEVFGWNGLRNTIQLSGQTSYTVTGLALRETYMFLADAADGGTGQPDLIVTDITWTPTTPTTGQAVTFSAVIKNQGTAATPAGVIHGVSFSVDGTQVNWSDTNTTSLAVNATRTLTATGGPTGANTWIATSGSHTVLADVDDVNRMAESNEGNNQFTKPLTIGAAQPDLIVTSVSWSPASPATGQAVTFSAIIQNTGSSATPAGTVHRVSFSVDGTVVNWSDTSTTALAPQATRTLTANSGPGGSSSWTATSGTHTILAKVDDTLLIAESNENNNTFTNSMTVAAGQPDLIVTDITWSPASPTSGQAVTFSAVIQNQGNGPTPAGVIHGVEFNVDGVQVSWSDTSTTSLAAGASRTVTANSGPNGGSSTWTATSGTHTILAHVDDVNRIVESNENNNTFSKTLTVASALPDLIVTDVTWSPAAPVTGQAVTFSAVIKNQGLAATPAGVVHRVSFSVDGVLVSFSNTSTTSLAVNGTRTLTANSGPGGSATWTATSGTHTILAQVDDTLLIAESNESNNSFSKSLTVTTTQPDLIVTSISKSPNNPSAGQAVTFSAVIKNQGNAATPAGVVHRVSFSVDGTLVSFSNTSTTSLAVNGTRTLTANSGPNGSATWSATGGTHTILANVDDTGLIAESNEGNNTATISLSVSGGQPDLIVTDITWTPASPGSGQAVTFTATVKNQGNAATPAGVILGVEFNVDGVQVSWSDTSTASLAAGATRTLTANSGPNGGVSTWTATAGTHTVMAHVDDVNRIAESNNNNNQFSKPITIP